MADSRAVHASLELLVTSDPIGAAAERLTRAVTNGLDGGAVDAVRSVHPIVRLAIPGGSALAVAGRSCEALGAAWRNVALTWVDERCVPMQDPDSNRGAAARHGLFASPTESVARPEPARVLPLFEDGESPAAAAARASDRLREEFSNALDVVLLGMGEDGHIASLFPPHAVGDDRCVLHVDDSPKPPADRISLTRRVLDTARSVILLAVGESKRSALERLVGGDRSLPAHGLPNLIVVTDLDLA